jgi:acyl carrier protein
VLDPRVAEAIADSFGVRSEEITPQSSAGVLPEWDSIGHLKLILYLEEVFGTRFPAREIATLTTAARIQEALTRLHALP